MVDLDAAVATQLRNIEQSTGRTLAEWSAVIGPIGARTHGDILTELKSAHGLTHGNANLLARRLREREAGGAASSDELLAAQYAGAKAGLRPVYEEVVSTARRLGDDVTVVVQKTGVSLRRRKQFAVVQAPSAKRVDLGLNLAGVEPSGRLLAARGMCTHRVSLEGTTDIDGEVREWLHAAYLRAG
jgi:hypothetical protein